MNDRQGRPSPFVLASKPSSSFSSISSAGSATSVATSRSGGSKLLFGEIDTSSDRSFESYASVCSFVLSDSSTFLKFWLDDHCRDTFLSYLPKRELASLRSVCHDFSVRAAPALLEDLSITFRTKTFTKPTRLAALDRLGYCVKSLTFNLPHTTETFLPPLVDPETGAELSFTYTPQLQASSARHPKYGDIGTTEILTRQYPALFHAATNVPAFIRALSALFNLQHLKISCPGYDPLMRQRRSVVDYALISLRIAVERNSLNALDSLTLSPVHPSSLLYLSPSGGYGASPRSSSRWSRIRHLTINLDSSPSTAPDDGSDTLKLLHTYLCDFQVNITTLTFRWNGEKGCLPTQECLMSAGHQRKGVRPMHFPQLKHHVVENVAASAVAISGFVESQKRTLEDLDLKDIELTSGTWDDALAPLTKGACSRVSEDRADIPILLSPSTFASLPAPMERLQPSTHPTGGRRSMRLSAWLHSRRSKPPISRKLKDGLLGCEEQLKKAFGGVWKQTPH